MSKQKNLIDVLHHFIWDQVEDGMFKIKFSVQKLISKVFSQIILSMDSFNHLHQGSYLLINHWSACLWQVTKNLVIKVENGRRNVWNVRFSFYFPLPIINLAVISVKTYTLFIIESENIRHNMIKLIVKMVHILKYHLFVIYTFTSVWHIIIYINERSTIRMFVGYPWFSNITVWDLNE